MLNKIGPNSCIKLQEDIFYLESGKHKHAGKRTIIGRILSETGFGFYNIEILASDGPNALGKGLIIQRPAGNILSAQDCTSWVSSISSNPTFKAGGHVEGTKDGKKVVMDSGAKGGMAVGASHKEGGIQGEVGTDGHKIEFQGNEAIINADAVASTKLNTFNGKKMTNREVLSAINQSAGNGVAFDKGGMASCKCTGAKYEYGGKTMSDYDIVNEINHTSQLEKGIQIENKEHRDVLMRLNDGYITIDKAIEEIAQKHLSENPNYYESHC